MGLEIYYYTKVFKGTKNKLFQVSNLQSKQNFNNFRLRK